MAKTAAQRQAQYRANRGQAGKDGNGERRLNTWIDTKVYLALERLAVRYCVTKREMIDRLVNTEDERIQATLHSDQEWDRYMEKQS